jgi:hypothetical protein
LIAIFGSGGSGDLNSSIDKIGRCWSHRPFRCPHLSRLGKEIRRPRSRRLFSAGAPTAKQLIAPPAKAPLQLRHERQGIGRQNLLATLVDAANDLDVGNRLSTFYLAYLAAPAAKVSGASDRQSAEWSANAGAMTKIGCSDWRERMLHSVWRKSKPASDRAMEGGGRAKDRQARS